jgi:two-component system, LytTR family, sensor kinase
VYKNLKNILIIFSVWTVAGLLYSAQSYFYRVEIGQDVNWLDILIIDMPNFILWFFLMPITVFLSRQFPFSKERWALPGTVHLSAAILVSIIHSTSYVVYRLWIKDGVQGITGSRIYINVFSTFDYSMLVYFIMLFVIQVMIYNKKLKDEHARSMQLQSDLVQSQLDVLKAQLQPHFLFNTLNSISVLTRENPKLADKTIHLLSDLLRYSLKHARQQFVTLEAEISFIKDYLAIEKIRFGNRLKIEIDVSPETLSINIPSLLLQPLVENAIKHGVAKKRGDGLIQIIAKKKSNYLTLQILDNGQGEGQQAHSENNLGLGLTNMQKRLDSLYGADYNFRLENEQDKGTRVLIEIPL